MVALIACTSRPREVLSDKKMENLLYDLYLTEGEIRANGPIFFADSIRKGNLLNSVLGKHKVSREQLDVSIDWYAHNLNRYQKILENLQTRYKEDIQALKLIEDTLPIKSTHSEGITGLPCIGDSIQFLNLYNLPENVFVFRTDTSFYQFGGIYELQFNALGVNETSGPELTFCVKCADTTFVRKSVMDKNGFYSMVIDITENKRFKEVYGYIYFPELTLRTNLFIYDFRILAHKNDQHLSEGDTLLEKRPENIVPVRVNQ
jgi:hypothetical protein